MEKDCPVCLLAPFPRDPGYRLVALWLWCTHNDRVGVLRKQNMLHFFSLSLLWLLYSGMLILLSENTGNAPFYGTVPRMKSQSLGDSRFDWTSFVGEKVTVYFHWSRCSLDLYLFSMTSVGISHFICHQISHQVKIDSWTTELLTEGKGNMKCKT